MGLTGWRPKGEVPAGKRFVVIAAPHTSNWDLFYTMIFAYYYRLNLRFMGKHTLFKFPLGILIRALGGIPILRDRSENAVTAAARLFKEYDELVLAVPAEGTRARADYWKSGFYHIARLAEVPIVLGFLDYGRKRGGFGAAIRPTDDVVSDMNQIREFYADISGHYPEKFGPIRLREEEQPAVSNG